MSNGYPNGGSNPWAPPSMWDLMSQVNTRIGGLETAIEMLIETHKQGFYKTDKAHERITRLQEQLDALEEWAKQHRSSGPLPLIPPPTAPQGGLIAHTLTAFAKCLEAGKDLLPPLKEVIMAAALLAAAFGLIADKAPTPPSPPTAASSPAR